MLIFKSIRWRLVLIYVLLILLAMSIVGLFITTRFESIQLDMNSNNIRIRAAAILASSTPMQSDDWEVNEDSIKKSVQSGIQLGYNENVYVILNNEDKTIIASSIDGLVGVSAYKASKLSNQVFVCSIDGSICEKVISNNNETEYLSHISYPVKNNEEGISGYIYLTNDINYVYETLEQVKLMLSQATIVVLIATVLVALILSSNITRPIKDLTIRARQMSYGNFDNKVEIKSDDEIGQLGKMFNFLVDELSSSISNLKQEKSKMDTTFNYMADGVLTVGIAGEIIHINPVAKRILNFRVNDRNYDDIMLRKKDKHDMKFIKQLRFEGKYSIKLGNEIYRVDFAPFMNGENETGGVIMVFKNITEQYKTEKQQKDFVANVSHELKTPITTIKSYTETLLEGAKNDTEILDSFLQVIDSESDRMSRLVSDLLKLSRMDFNNDNWKREVIVVDDMLISIRDRLKMQADSKNIEIRFSPQDNGAQVKFDVDGLERIFLNVIGNAIKYTTDDGAIYIDTYHERKYLVVSVEDTGVGIPEEDLNHVFDRFYRVDKARSREMGGTGLGLSIAKEIAEAHDSFIDVASTLGVGTKVIIKIPKYKK